MSVDAGELELHGDDGGVLAASHLSSLAMNLPTFCIFSAENDEDREGPDGKFIGQ
jgi:hypothetical protein